VNDKELMFLGTIIISKRKEVTVLGGDSDYFEASYQHSMGRT
jgi:hypothetical protein